MKRNKKGFTIVELVIVIAVIAILSAILIPTFVNLTQKAEDARAISEVNDAYTAYIIDVGDKGNYLTKEQVAVVYKKSTDVYTYTSADGWKKAGATTGDALYESVTKNNTVDTNEILVYAKAA